MWLTPTTSTCDLLPPTTWISNPLIDVVVGRTPLPWNCCAKSCLCYLLYHSCWQQKVAYMTAGCIQTQGLWLKHRIMGGECWLELTLTAVHQWNIYVQRGSTAWVPSTVDEQEVWQVTGLPVTAAFDSPLDLACSAKQRFVQQCHELTSVTTNWVDLRRRSREAGIWSSSYVACWRPD